MKKLFLALMLCAPSAYAAPAVKIPPLKICMNKVTGGILTRKNCAPSETPLSGAILQGLAGVGPQGAPGTVDPTRCVPRTAFGIVTSLGTEITARCNFGEFLMTHGVDTSITSGDLAAYVSGIKVGASIGSPNVLSAVRYSLGAVSSNTIVSATVTAVCCPY